MGFQSHSLCKVCDEYTGGGDFCSLAHYGEYKANKAKYDSVPPYEEDSTPTNHTPSMHVGSGRTTHIDKDTDVPTEVDQIDKDIAEMIAEEHAIQDFNKRYAMNQSHLLPAHYTKAIEEFENAQKLKKALGYKIHKSPIGFIG